MQYTMLLSSLRGVRARPKLLGSLRAISDGSSQSNSDDLRSKYYPNTSFGIKERSIKSEAKPEKPLPTLLAYGYETSFRESNESADARKAPSIDPNLVFSDQRQLAQLPSYKIRAMIQYDTLTPECINLILRFIAAKQVPATMLGLVEEKALSYLSIDDEDLVTKYIRRTPDFDYDSICGLFMGLASNQRRPTPLLKAAATHLCRLPAEKRADFTLIAGALSALVSLNYPSKPLIARLMHDLTTTVNFDRLGSKAMCNLFRIMRSLRWRNDKLIEGIIDHLSDNPSQCDPIVMSTLVQVLSYLDYPNSGVLQLLHKSFVEQGKEDSIRKDPKMWLGYVWSLVALKLADKRYLESVMSDEFCKSLSDPESEPPIGYSDAMKLLNLKVLAEREYELEVDCVAIDSLAECKIQRSAESKRFHQKMENVIKAIIGSEEKMLSDVATPFGFTIDFEMAKDKNSSQLLPIDASKTLDARAHHSGSRHLAVILVGYEDTLANKRAEPVGYKKMISRIFNSFDYQTVFLPEVILNREKTSADLTNKVKNLLALPVESLST